MARRRRVLLYADVDLNVVDGSSVWVTSMADALSRSSDVDLLLKVPVVTDRLVGPVRALPGVRVLEASPPEARARGRGRGETTPVAPLSPDAAAGQLVALDAEDPYDVVVARGRLVCHALARSGAVDGRLWPYMTDVPQAGADMTEDVRGQLGDVARSSRRLFAQTEDARAFLEHHVPEAAGKVVLLPPMIPDVPAIPDVPGPDRARGLPAAHLAVVYAGKFAKDWRTLEMCDLPRRAAGQGVRLQLTMIGDKVQAARGDRAWGHRMRAALEREDITWAGGVGRAEVLAAVAKHDVGLAWRAPTMDASHELSTKVLEYAAVGVPPVLNRSAMHEELLGADYPLFVDDTTVVDVLARAATDPAVLARAREVIVGVAARFTVSAAAERLETLLRRHDRIRAEVAERRRVVVAGHDLKFAGELVDHLARRDDVELVFDHWTSLHAHDTGHSQDLVSRADVVLCEFAGPNAVWYSREKRPGQRLVVRLHMFELRGPWLDGLETAAVDALVCVSDHAARATAERLGLEREAVRVVPNVVDAADLARPKLLDARFHLGMVGIVPVLKRVDRALDLLESLRTQDLRFALHLRGRLPNEYPWEWRKPAVRSYYEEQFHRIRTSPLLAGAVSLDAFGPDIASWLRKVGWVLSPSTAESFHLAPAEGMASGSIPVAWDRDGAADVLGERYVRGSTEAAAEAVLAMVDRWADESRLAQRLAGRYDVDQVMPLWDEVLGLR